jgi:hypothetical protein
MGCLRRLLLLNLVLWVGAAAAQDRLSVNGDLDLRWVQASGVTSFLNGGLGILRVVPGMRASS